MTKIQIINHSESCSKSKIPIIPILPNKSQAQNPKNEDSFLDLGFGNYFGFGSIYLPAIRQGFGI